MKWLTQQQVKDRARGPKSALNVSILHWKQLSDATEEELLEMFNESEYFYSSQYCGLCYRYIDNDDGCVDVLCPIAKAGDRCTNEDSLWENVNNSFLDIKRRLVDSELKVNNEDFATWQAAARNMYELLLSLKEKK